MDEITILQAEILRTLSSPRRIDILHALATGPREVGRLAASLGASQPNVSQHLAVLRSLGADPISVRRPAELAACDGLVLPGGESTTMAKLARIFELLEPLRARVGEGLPMFGTCAGMILLADRIEDGVVGQETLGGLDIRL